MRDMPPLQHAFADCTNPPAPSAPKGELDVDQVINNAIFDAVGVRVKTLDPPQKILRALKEKQNSK